jgi:hypothetical protein
MTDAQMVTIAAAFLAAIVAVLFNNSRISDLRDSVNQHIEDKFKLLDTKLDHIIELLATYDARITKLERRP